MLYYMTRQRRCSINISKIYDWTANITISFIFICDFLWLPEKQRPCFIHPSTSNVVPGMLARKR